MRKIFLLIFVIAAFSSCKKSEVEIVPSNQAPPDKTIPAVTIENYINKTYILTLGREPSETEFNLAKVQLTNSSLDSESRKHFLTDVFQSSDYLPHLYNENRINLLNDADTADISGWIFIFQYYLLDSTYQLQWPYLETEAQRLITLRNAYADFVSGAMPVAELQSIMTNNYLYDQINMGSANFVIATFQNLINRNPTMAEQQAGVSMVDGNNSILFLTAGYSKNDFLNIFTHSRNFYEGQVILLYLKYLHRVPTSVEMAAGTDIYSSTGDYTAIQKEILSTDEFIGL